MPTFDAQVLLRQDLTDFPPYVAAPVAIADMERIIKLDANENPYGPSPKVLAALADTRVWNRYATQDELRPLIAHYVGAEPEQIVVGNGADEMIDLIQRIFLQPGDAVLDCPPSFEMYRVFAAVNGARVLDVPRRFEPAAPLGPRFCADLDAIEQVVVREHPKIVFVTNPNNPDGSLYSPADLERLLALPALIVMDEAYAEFSGSSLVARVATQANLVILRTFSKWAGLAGLRVGYAVAPKPVADRMMRTKSPYNVNMAAIVAARASLEDVDYLYGNVQRIIAERGRLSLALADLGFLQPLPTHSNFILCHVSGLSARDLYTQLAQRGILVRVFGSPRLAEFVRISVGTREQNAALLDALKETTHAA
jgi:histidinol-phosphate aminotransferase